MNDANEIQPASRPLIVGIFLMPFIFSWFTLKSGYSIKGRLFAFGWMIIVLVLAAMDSSVDTVSNSASTNSSLLDFAQAQEYRTIEFRSYPTPPDKSGLEIFIYAPAASTFDERAHTMIKAAYELLESEGLYEVIIRLSALPSNKPKYIQAGRAKYTPHKKNTWGDEEMYVWDIDSSQHRVVDGKIEEDGKLYDIDWMPSKEYLKK